MMDTILNLGLTDASVAGLANSTGNPRFAYDSYRRLIQMFGDVVMGVDHDHFEEAFGKIKLKYKASTDTEVPAQGMIDLCDAYKAVYRRYKGEDFPQNPFKQLELAIEAVFKSWNGDRAVSYRRIAGISGLNGTAVNVQTMVYGNMGDDSGTGVAFTRNNATGENVFYGEFLINAQGEDVVAGIRTPLHVDQMPKWNKEVYKQLLDIKVKLEKHYKDMQDIEFTIERGKLYMLQTRTGKRTGSAAVRIACDMVREKLIDERTALVRIPAGGDAGHPRQPRGGVREARLHRRGGRAAVAGGREGAAGARVHQPRGRGGHAQRRGHPDQHGRADQPRGGGRVRVGQVLRGGRGRAVHRRGQGRDDGQGQEVRA
jgi:pyruvate, orthophosphate dikinase